MESLFDRDISARFAGYQLETKCSEKRYEESQRGVSRCFLVGNVFFCSEEEWSQERER